MIFTKDEQGILYGSPLTVCNYFKSAQLAEARSRRMYKHIKELDEQITKRINILESKEAPKHLKDEAITYLNKHTSIYASLTV